MTCNPISLAEHLRQQKEFLEGWQQYHRSLVRQRALADAVAERLMTLSGDELDAYLRKLGFDPDDLLREFNEAFGLDGPSLPNGERGQ